MASAVHNIRRRAFTLIELLIVVAIIAVLIAILLPSLKSAQETARAVKCMSNQRQIGLGLVAYNTQNNNFIIPSYNMPVLNGVYASADDANHPLDGWAPILDRDGYVPSREQNTNTIFYCPDTVNVEGMKTGQTGAYADNPDWPRGWVDWPMWTEGGDSGAKTVVTIPDRGFNKIIRVSYFINAYNPLGSPGDPAADVYYTASVGLALNSGGGIQPHHTSSIRRPSDLVVTADGLYMGRQKVMHLGDSNSRIGYRHIPMVVDPLGNQTTGGANVAFADGHAELVPTSKMPIAKDYTHYNISGFTVYADPQAAQAAGQ